MRAAIAASFLSLIATFAFAHPGGLDEEGCHNDKKAAERHCHNEHVIAKKLASCELNVPPKAGDEGVFFGTFGRVKDGDTFTAKVQGVVMDFRLAAVDAPETDQPYGNVSTKGLQSLLQRKQLVLVPTDTDQGGRTVVFVWTGKTCINKEMIRRGHAWFYDEFSDDATLHAEENKVRDAKIGLWKLPLEKRVEPWVWRHEKR